MPDYFRASLLGTSSAVNHAYTFRLGTRSGVSLCRIGRAKQLVRRAVHGQSRPVPKYCLERCALVSSLLARSDHWGGGARTALSPSRSISRLACSAWRYAAPASWSHSPRKFSYQVSINVDTICSTARPARCTPEGAISPQVLMRVFSVP